jgi:hypothetical protein
MLRAESNLLEQLRKCCRVSISASPTPTQPQSLLASNPLPWSLSSRWLLAPRNVRRTWLSLQKVMTRIRVDDSERRHGRRCRTRVDLSVSDILHACSRDARRVNTLSGVAKDDDDDDNELNTYALLSMRLGDAQLARSVMRRMGSDLRIPSEDECWAGLRAWMETSYSTRNCVLASAASGLSASPFFVARATLNKLRISYRADACLRTTRSGCQQTEPERSEEERSAASNHTVRARVLLDPQIVHVGDLSPNSSNVAMWAGDSTRWMCFLMLARYGDDEHARFERFLKRYRNAWTPYTQRTRASHVDTLRRRLPELAFGLPDSQTASSEASTIEWHGSSRGCAADQNVRQRHHTRSIRVAHGRGGV